VITDHRKGFQKSPIALKSENRFRATGLGLVGALFLLSLLAIPSASAQPLQPSLNVKYMINLDQHYKFYGYLTEEMTVNINGTMNPQTTPIGVTITFPFSYDKVVGLPSGANFSLLSKSVSGVPFTQLQVQIPGSQSTFDFTVDGSLEGLSSFFFRNIGDMPPVYVQTTAPPFAPTTTNILVPEEPSMQVRAVYPSNASQVISTGGKSYLQLSPQVIAVSNCEYCPPGMSLLYQSSLSDYYGFLAIAAIVSVGVIFSVMAWRLRAVFRRMWGVLPSRGKPLLGALTKRRGPKALLSIFMGVCILMIALSAMFGPPPQPRAYLAATPSSSNAIGPYINQAGWSYLAEGQAADGFTRTAQYGTFSSVVIADFPPQPSAPALNYFSPIIVLSSYVTPSYVQQLQTIHPDNVVVVNDTSSLVGVLAGIGGRQNIVGIFISEHLYVRAAAIVGVLSILVPFLALAFLASLLVDLGGRGAGGFLEVAAYTIMVYFVAEFAFIVSTVMLGMPVALHAAISNKETAEGLIGPFGGGTRPREVAGIVGFLFGVVYNKKSAISFDRNVLAALLGAIGFFIVDPLNVASTFYDALLTVSSNADIGATNAISETLRGFIGQALSAFQSSLTPGFIASHGAALFFLSAVPFVLYPRVGKGTGTVLIIFCALGCGLGFVRIADMIPVETIASATPGLAIGFLLLPVFWVMSKLEGLARKSTLVG
jgi:hypothetical protein